MVDGARILIVEDDKDLARMLQDLLGSEGYATTLARDGQRALHEGLTNSFDVLLLDRGLPVIDGLSVLMKLRDRGVITPALILSALANPADRVEGLDRGAEDYLPKPFDIDELLARLRALLRRPRSMAHVLRFPGGSFDTDSRTASLANSVVVLLSEREGSLLAHLAKRPNQVFARGELLDAVFPDADDRGVVDTYVHYLRKKIGRKAVLTIRGVGYQLGHIDEA
ncbi:response regulator transcription factor [Glaciibacter superstes]|uniref:response regulator transcription factor n=1 Tax=Glaciibacter superstes TaxID=501023 RepID=UPI0004114158|nr:response regulator transcription factor [Glaciibacter superstes]